MTIPIEFLRLSLATVLALSPPKRPSGPGVSVASITRALRVLEAKIAAEDKERDARDCKWLADELAAAVNPEAIT